MRSALAATTSFPAIAVEHQREAPGAGQEGHVADMQHRILHQRRQRLQVVLVLGGEMEQGAHGLVAVESPAGPEGPAGAAKSSKSPPDAAAGGRAGRSPASLWPRACALRRRKLAFRASAWRRSRSLGADMGPRIDGGAEMRQRPLRAARLPV